MTVLLSPEIEKIVPPEELLSISKRIAQKDVTIWGPGTEAPTRMGWVDLATRSRILLPLLDALSVSMRDRGMEEVVLSGMGGSSLAPEVIARSFASDAARRLTILDSTHPDFIESILHRDLSRTMFVISSKSGTTIETSSHLAAIRQALREQSLDPIDHLLVVTDPGSPLEELATEQSWRCVVGDPEVGGRFSALSAFGLVPTALLGLDPSLILDDAEELLAKIHEPATKIALYLAQERFVYFKDSGSNVPGLADWIEQLIAESTGKQGKGVLPIALNSSEPHSDDPVIDLANTVVAPLGAHFILWEWVTALLGYLLKVDPFDQPDVQATKSKTSEVLRTVASLRPEDGAIPIDQFASAVNQLLRGRSYLAICAFLDPRDSTSIAQLQGVLAKRFRVPVAFGWGPRFLHSTGQFHKGGPHEGVFISITSKSKANVEIPGRDFSFDSLILAQAWGDRMALVESGSPVIQIHLDDPKVEINRLLAQFNDV